MVTAPHLSYRPLCGGEPQLLTRDMIIKDGGQLLQKHELYKIRETGSRLRQIGHFRVPKTLTFKMRPSAQMSFICMRMKNHFHIKGWALNLFFIQRSGGTRKWPIAYTTLLYHYLHNSFQNHSNSCKPKQHWEPQIPPENRTLYWPFRSCVGNWGKFQI